MSGGAPRVLYTVAIQSTTCQLPAHPGTLREKRLRAGSAARVPRGAKPPKVTPRHILLCMCLGEGHTTRNKGPSTVQYGHARGPKCIRGLHYPLTTVGHALGGAGGSNLQMQPQWLEGTRSRCRCRFFRVPRSWPGRAPVPHCALYGPPRGWGLLGRWGGGFVDLLLYILYLAYVLYYHAAHAD
jgi:hypothetical protein